MRLGLVVSGGLAAAAVLGWFCGLTMRTVPVTGWVTFDRTAMAGLVDVTGVQEVSLIPRMRGAAYGGFVDYIPNNIFSAMVDFNALQLVIISLLMGFSSSLVSEKHNELWLTALDVVYEVFTKLTAFILRALPLALFFLIVGAVGDLHVLDPICSAYSRALNSRGIAVRTHGHGPLFCQLAMYNRD